MKNLKEKYEPKNTEPKIYESWEKSGYFNPDKLPDELCKKNAKPYVIVIPPPNITGSLHMGHALNGTIQDVLIRYHRMKGFRALWVPGVDHAGIATQNMVEKGLAKEDKTRQDIGRAEMLELLKKWEEKYSKRILGQLKKIGASCDFSRTRYTLDKDYSKAVQKAFKEYKNKGLIKRGKGRLYYIKYRLKPRKKKAKKLQAKKPRSYITIATTRPETLLGDTAVAVNPQDKRYQDLIKRKAIVPIVNRAVPIIADEEINKSFGTGALKVTPAHDPVDFEIGQKHELKSIQVIDEDGEMTKDVPLKFRGLDRFEARKKVLEKLRNDKILAKTESFKHSVPYCYRCDSVIEPLVSKQWFVSMKKLAEPAIKIVEKDRIKFVPQRYKKVYLNWMGDIKDWCISRQIWWGHKINIKDSEDVLDTWFSSALWPFAVLGWPEKTKDLKEFYPTDVLSTAKDIIFLWVARMIFSSLFFLDKKPFRTVYIHPTILNKEGKRMSKSLGTGVDPLDLIDKYGADATRFGLISKAGRNQEIRFDESAIIAGRNFANKMLNASRFILLNLDKNKIKKLKVEKEILKDKKILKNKVYANTIKSLRKTKESTEKKLDEFRFDLAAEGAYRFFWNQFCDKCIEASKEDLYKGNDEDKKRALKFLLVILTRSLKMLHPFMPFVTEYLWAEIHDSAGKKSRPLMVSKW